MYTVLVRGLEVYAYHGVTAEERTIGHRYRVDLELLVDGRADVTDSVEDTVDYGVAAGVVSDAMMAGQHHTVEHLAALVADQLLTADSRIESLEITLVKLFPPMPFIASEAGVRLLKRREPSALAPQSSIHAPSESP